MIEMGIETSLMQSVLQGNKVLEVRLRTAKFVTIRKGDIISFREDIWKDGRLVGSSPGVVNATVTETAFFDSFAEALESVDYKQILPGAATKSDVMNMYHQFYSPEQIAENGVVAIRFVVK